MFAGSCIGVILLVILLEFLRRLGKEYDRKILHEHQRKFAMEPISQSSSADAGKSDNKVRNKPLLGPTSTAAVFRPGVGQQAIRALLHMLAFAVAYFIML